MAKHNYLCMRQEEIQGLVTGIGRTSGSVSAAGTGMKGKFAPATSSGLMTKQVGTVSKQMHAISSSMSNIQSIVNKHSNQMFEFDSTMAKKANDIEIPTDFLANNSIEVNQYNRFLLGKIDGRSVNEGEKAQEFNEIDEYKISAENLTNISGNVTELQNYDSSSVIGRSILGKIDGDVTQLQNYDDSSQVQKDRIVNISGDVTQEQEYDSSSNIQKGAMQDIRGQDSQKLEVDESTVIGRSVLGGVNTVAPASRLEKDNNATSIASINLTSVKDHKKSDDEDFKNLLNAQGVTAQTLMAVPESDDVRTAVKRTERKSDDYVFNAELASSAEKRK